MPNLATDGEAAEKQALGTVTNEGRARVSHDDLSDLVEDSTRCIGESGFRGAGATKAAQPLRVWTISESMLHSSREIQANALACVEKRGRWRLKYT
jgi:hypothetical protein